MGDAASAIAAALCPGACSERIESVRQWPSFDAPKPLADIDETACRSAIGLVDGMRRISNAKQVTPVNATVNGAWLYVTGGVSFSGVRASVSGQPTYDRISTPTAFPTAHIRTRRER